ncbi:NUDIX domain-containing protein [Paraburkholderia fungorum]|uniref:NUDIX domain-containing protein n=1 Tax=Paraburkholderia fungorum TaxID=134537 RepID=A0A1H1JYG8_9BURK|nr:NUDIX domain-containing protein [Paraburkholderia fungorum]SDR55073.1 NUDIX domain-containing protein [Paraburkholderia fungorum]
MIAFDLGTHRFQFRAAVVITRSDHVLLHQVEGQDFWCLPGGRVEPGERAEQTVIREMREEVGADIDVGKMLWTVENFFSHESRQHHEIGLYFAATLKAGSPMLDLPGRHHGVEGSKRLEFAWFPRVQVSSLDIRPAFLRKFLAQSQLEPAHVVQDGERFTVSRS